MALHGRLQARCRRGADQPHPAGGGAQPGKTARGRGRARGRGWARVGSGGRAWGRCRGRGTG